MQRAFSANGAARKFGLPGGAMTRRRHPRSPEGSGCRVLAHEKRRRRPRVRTRIPSPCGTTLLHESLIDGDESAQELVKRGRGWTNYGNGTWGVPRDGYALPGYTGSPRLDLVFDEDARMAGQIVTGRARM